MQGEVGQINTPIAPSITVAGVAGHRAEFAHAVLGDAMQSHPLASDKVGDCLIAALAEALIVVGIAGVVGMTGQQQGNFGVALHLRSNP